MNVWARECGAGELFYHYQHIFIVFPMDPIGKKSLKLQNSLGNVARLSKTLLGSLNIPWTISLEETTPNLL